jgi:hypothetical protein
MWRDPQPRWVSPIGRVVQIGDSAHPFLPTSASGGTMAMEDAFSLAACLQIAGKNKACLATKVHNQLRSVCVCYTPCHYTYMESAKTELTYLDRFERVSSAQKMGFKNREVFHNTDWDVITRNPEAMGKMVGDWVIYHDPEQYAYDSYKGCADHILEGAPFEHRNTVPGYTYKPWTVKQLLEASSADKPVVDEGTWD